MSNGGRLGSLTCGSLVLALLVACGAAETGESSTDARPLAQPPVAQRSVAPAVAVRPILLGSGTITAPDEAVEIAPGRHHILQFQRIPTKDERRALAAQGITLLGYLPERSFWARIAPHAGDVARLDIAGGLVVARPASSQLKLASVLTNEAAVEGSVSVAVHFFADATSSEIAMARAALGDSNVTGSSREGREGLAGYATVTLPRDQVGKLADLEAVQWIEPSMTTPTTHSAVGNKDHNVKPLRSLPYGLDGAGVAVAIWDAGWVDWEHPDLAGRVFYDPELLAQFGKGPIASATAKHAHPTHMAGVIASSGAGNAAAQGTAPAATIYSYREAYRYSNINEIVASESAAHGWRVMNHSYGNGFPCSSPSVEPCKSSPLWTSYIQDARDADTWAYDSGVLSVYSAGNDGLYKAYPDNWDTDNWSTIYSGASAKNVIATGGAMPLTKEGKKFQVRNDSSKGPASDGRVKPDLCAEAQPWGDSGVVWTTELGGGYVPTQATSPAAAQVTGIVALLQQAYHQLHGDSAELPPELAKGLLIHTATDLVETNSYRSSNNAIFASNASVGPDFTTGWGFPDAKAAVDVLQSLSSIRDGSVDDGVTRELDTSVAAASTLKVTLVWNDPPASVGAARALVNDLDLKITNLSTGEESYPWVLDKAHPMLPAEHGINQVDNVEQVVLKNDATVSQSYRISIRGSAVPEGPQPFYVLSNFPLAVVVYGTQRTFNGDLGGRSGADAKCLAEKPAVCGNAANAHAVISISTEDEMQDMQNLYGIPAATPVVGSKGLPLADGWEALWGHSIANPLEVATNLPVGSTYWSGSSVAGATKSYATPGSQYLCSNFTSGTSGFRPPHGASHLTTPAEPYALGWDGGNVYLHCSRVQHLLCACW